MAAGVSKLEAALKEMHAASDEFEAAKLARVLRLDTMIEVRKVVDDVEAICPADKWTIATYKELCLSTRASSSKLVNSMRRGGIAGAISGAVRPQQE